MCLNPNFDTDFDCSSRPYHPLLAEVFFDHMQRERHMDEDMRTAEFVKLANACQAGNDAAQTPENMFLPLQLMA